MTEWNGRQRGSHGRQTGGHYKPRSARSDADGFNTEEIFELYRRPELRMQDNPAHVAMGAQLMVEPNDPYLQEFFGLVVNSQTEQAMQSNDPFWGNYPPKDSVPMSKSTVVIATMPTGDKIGIETNRACSIGFFGLSQVGKTTLLKCFLPPVVRNGVDVVVFERKKDLRHLAVLPELQDLATILIHSELKLSLLQPPPGVPDEIWANELTTMTAQCYGRRGAERLMRDILGETLAKKTPEGYPPLYELTQDVEAFRPRFGMREAEYKGSILWVLKDLMNNTGGPNGIFGYCSSDLLEKLFSRPGLVIIEAETLPTDHLVFLMTYMMRWLYVRRLYEK